MGTEYAAPFSGQAISTSQEYRDRHRPSQPDMIDASYGSGDLLVTNAANVNVSIAIGSAVVQGALYKLTVSAHTLPVAANGGGSNRFDIVCLTYDASTSPGVRLRIVQGTPGAGLPALTNSLTGVWDFPLAHYEKQPGGNIVNMVDRRKFSDGQGGIIGGAGSNYPPAPRVGHRLKSMPDGSVHEWDGAAWNVIDSGYDLLTYTPVWTADSGTTTLSAGTLVGRYKIINRKTVHSFIRFAWGAGTTQSVPGSNWRFSLPTSADDTINSGTMWIGNVWGIQGAGVRVTAHGYVTSNVSPALLTTIMADNGAGIWDQAIPWAWTTGDRFSAQIIYPMG